MSATGAWRLTMNTPFGVQTPLLKIDGASGALESDRGSAALEDLKIDGDKISFSSKVPTPMGEFPVSFEAEISGDSLAGNYETMMGSTPFTGVREA
jgi:hypothetical protein